MKRWQIALIAIFVTGAATFVVAAYKIFGEIDTTTSLTKWDDLLAWEAKSLLNDPHYAQQFIRTGPPQLTYNCHGWTFTRGRRDVGPAEVEQMLKSDRFRTVKQPFIGDIIIYYDDAGAICHSGVVKATGFNGFVLIESKWGAAGRFLHLPSVPKAQVSHTFYRRIFQPPPQAPREQSPREMGSR